VKALHAAGYETGEVDVDFNWVSWNDGVTNEKHIAEDLAAVSLDTIPAVRGLLYVIGLTSTTSQYHPHPYCPPVTSLLCGFVLSLFLCRYGTLGDALAYMGDFSETMKQRCLDSLNYKYHVFKATHPFYMPGPVRSNADCAVESPRAAGTAALTHRWRCVVLSGCACVSLARQCYRIRHPYWRQGWVAGF